MAALVAEPTLDLTSLHDHLASRLPPYARPSFLRLCPHANLTGTFKYVTTELARQGYDPTRIADPLFFDLHDAHAFVPLDKNLYARIQTGEIRL
jgi:fatty-acyl-CoA synthase